MLGMFDTLQQQLSGLFKRGTSSVRGDLSEQSLIALRNILLEADVGLEATKAIQEDIRVRFASRAAEGRISESDFADLVFASLTDFLGGSGGGSGGEDAGAADQSLAEPGQPPVLPPVLKTNRKTGITKIMLVGLQGSGKTTTAGKLAWWMQKQGHHPMTVSFDFRRPAGMEQLQLLSTQQQIPAFSSPEQEPSARQAAALEFARQHGCDTMIIDTAGRTTNSPEDIAELKVLFDAVKPDETLFVGDALQGQEAVTTAREFAQAVKLTGNILTRIDGDSRGGAAISMRFATGRPIKFMGTSEKIDGIEPFYPERIASRLLDRGDMDSLIERITGDLEATELDEGDAVINDLDGMRRHLGKLKKLGGAGALLGMLPGMGAMREKVKSFDNRAIDQQLAMINSMTRHERANPDLILASRKKRIANGSGVTVSDVNKLMKQYWVMQNTMQMMQNVDQEKLMGQVADGQLPADIMQSLGKGSARKAAKSLKRIKKTSRW